MTQVLQQSHIPTAQGRLMSSQRTNNNNNNNNSGGNNNNSSSSANGKLSASRIPQNVSRSISESVQRAQLFHQSTDQSSTSGVGNGGDSTADELDEESDALSDLIPPTTPRSAHSMASPRCEAFVMTGDKILRLNSKISPSYAQDLREARAYVEQARSGYFAYKQQAKQAEKAKQDQLPPVALKKDGIAIDDTPKRGPFDDYGGAEYKHKHTKHQRKFVNDNACNGLPNSQSAHALGDGSHQSTSNANSESGREASRTQTDDDDGGNSCVTVNALCGQSAAQHSQQTLPPLSPTSMSNGFSEPGTPSRYQGQDSRSPVVVRRQAENKDNTLIIRVSNSTIDDRKTIVAGENGFERMEGQGGQMMMTLSMVASGHGLTDHEIDAARRLAKRLFELDGFRKSDVSMQLAKNNEFSAHVAREYLSLFNFAGLRIDAALRKFLGQFCLTGESSERERVLNYFSQRYNQCNPAVFANDDEVHTLACALLLLNSDLHGPNLGKRMSCHDFIENLSQAGYNYKRDLLKSLYQALKSAQIEWAGDTDEELRGSASATSSSKKSGTEDSNLEHQVEYKKGYVLRKCVFEQNGKKTPFGRRGWRMFYATLKGLVLYLHKDEHGFTRGQYQTYRNAIKLHHAQAMHVNRSSYSGKRQHIFRVRTADMAEYMFQSSSKDEVDQWIDAINLVAASFSSPPLPAPVSSQSTFHRPMLPSTVTRLSLPEQLTEHERQADDIGSQLDRLKEEAPPLTAKGRCVQEYFFRERYLEEERTRYLTYVSLLRTKLSEHQSSFYVNHIPTASASMSPSQADNLSAVNMDALPPPGVLVVSSPHHYVPGGSLHNTSTTATTSRTCSDSIPPGSATHRNQHQAQSTTTSGSLNLDEERYLHQQHHQHRQQQQQQTQQQHWYEDTPGAASPQQQHRHNHNHANNNNNSDTDHVNNNNNTSISNNNNNNSRTPRHDDVPYDERPLPVNRGAATDRDSDRHSYREALDSHGQEELSMQF